MASVTDESNDRSVVLSEELLKIFGTSAPGGDTQINSVKTKQISTNSIYCAGDIRVNGRFRAPIQAARGVIVPAGTATLPSIVVGDIGVFGAGPALGTTGGITIGGPIGTTSGNLVLNPTGPAVDFSGKTIINAAGGGIPSVGNPNEVVVNNALGALTSESALAPVRGGLGLDTSAATGFPRVDAGAWSIGAITGADLGGSLTLDTLTATETISQRVNPENTSTSYIGAVTTVDDSPGMLVELATFDRGFGASHTLRGQVALVEQGTALTGSITFMAKIKNLNGNAEASALIGVGKIMDTPLTGDIILLADGGSVAVMAQGSPGRTISWCMRLDVVQVTL